MRSATSIHYPFSSGPEASATFPQGLPNTTLPASDKRADASPVTPPTTPNERSEPSHSGQRNEENHAGSVAPTASGVASSFVERRDPTRRRAVFVRRDRNPFASDEQYGLFVDLIETHLGTPGCFVGFQTGFKSTPDQILFRHPVVGSTLAVPVSIMLERREHAREVVRQKIEETARKWGANGAA